VASVKWTDSVAPLRERNFRWFFASRFVNMFGGVMANIALAFAVLDITDSPAALGQVLSAHTIPVVIFLLGGGVIADRFPRAVVLQVSNVVSGSLQAAIALLVITQNAEIWMLVVLTAIQGVSSAVAFPAMASIMPQLVPRDQLQQANALNSLLRGSLNIIAPTIGALLVVTVGSGWALMADALTWFVAAGLLLPVRIPARPVKTEEKPSAIAELREGWTFFWQTTWLWVVVVAFCFLNAIHAGALLTLGPAVAKATFGAQGWGLVLSAESAGLLLMTLVMLRVRLERPLLLGMLGVAALGLPVLMLGLRPEVAALVVAAFIAGAGIELFSIGWNLAMQENIDEQMLSRAYSYDALGSFVAIPVGQLAFGPLAVAFGYEEVLVVSGIAYFVICGLTLLSRSVRDLPRRSEDQKGVEPSGQPAA
jgi:MFS family permease